MANYQIGENLYAEDTGKQYNLNNGVKSYIKSPYETSQEKINQMYDSQRTNQLGLLKQQRDKAIGGFNQQKQELTPQYASQRNQADVTNAQNVTRLRELMAANGINMSGENVTAQANMNSARQNSFNDINNNENQAMGAIDKQIANANDPAQEQAINNSIEADRSKAMNDAFSQSQQQAYQQKQDWQAYQMQQQQFAYQKQMDQQQLALARQKATTSSRAAAAKVPKVQKLSKAQSFADGNAYWSSKIDDVKKEGAFRVEKALRSDPAQIQALTSQGYDLESVVDALYNSASSGQFTNKASYISYVDKLNSQVAASKKQKENYKINNVPGYADKKFGLR